MPNFCIHLGEAQAVKPPRTGVDPEETFVGSMILWQVSERSCRSTWWLTASYSAYAAVEGLGHERPH